MVLALIVVAALLLLAVAYRVRAACAPFTTHGRRRGIYLLRGWWHGDQGENRDEY